MSIANVTFKNGRVKQILITYDFFKKSISLWPTGYDAHRFESTAWQMLSNWGFDQELITCSKSYGFLINYCDRLWLPPLITFKISHSLFPKLIHNSISNFSYRDILDSLALLSIIPDYHIANELIAYYKHYFIFYLYQFDIIWWIHHVIFDV